MKTKTVTRAEVRAWPNQAVVSARVVDHDEHDDDDDMHNVAWEWLLYGGPSPRELGLGERAAVEVRSDTRTGGEWVRVAE